jgi:hypothetical protein
LNRDEYFSKMVEEKGGITLEAILSCPKIKGITGNQSDITEALELCKDFELEGDLVKRKKPFVKKITEDDSCEKDEDRNA